MRTLKDLEVTLHDTMSTTYTLVHPEDLREWARECIKELGGKPDYVINAEKELERLSEEEDDDTKYQQIDICQTIIRNWRKDTYTSGKIDWIRQAFNLEDEE